MYNNNNNKNNNSNNNNNNKPRSMIWVLAEIPPHNFFQGREPTAAAWSQGGLGGERGAWLHPCQCELQQKKDSLSFNFIFSFKASIEISVRVTKVERDLVFNFLDQISSGTFRRG